MGPWLKHLLFRYLEAPGKINQVSSQLPEARSRGSSDRHGELATQRYGNLFPKM
jgi:hypothetical protein